MNIGAKNNIIAIKKTNFICWHRIYYDFIMAILRSFSPYNSKNQSLGKILISDLKSASKNMSI